ncbi:MAG: hypothetical protein Q4F21_13175 [Lachnospiraceae bacterium]|nr:hypothetical protein [Lachnospiraceae bacterium]
MENLQTQEEEMTQEEALVYTKTVLQMMMNQLTKLDPEECFQICNNIKVTELCLLITNDASFNRFIDDLDSEIKKYESMRSGILKLKSNFFSVMDGPVVERTQNESADTEPVKES